ncbi:aminotransferase class V-fold PLP-dependent enzyme [Virgisporangium ochraceum]|uniref:Class V aminotransferase n=1 Tax=Virgisporangium ochraceum TaxID=65505 RepID=A0A8J3ZL39_9ACTN|nr:aminotransferase class V-fold PLP-dependent enzyme [Virgisporangium ochraceum]GIJ66319.1 class V aminotransferase [Virgisporangium ochraceum]
MVTRRGVLAAAAATTAACTTETTGGQDFDPSSWASVKAQFPHDRDSANFAAFVFASHLPPVKQAIERYAASLDRDPTGFLASDEDRLDREVATKAGDYLKADPGSIAFTDSTTAGLGLMYSGLRLGSGDEILTTEHDFYATHESLRLLAARTGCTVKKVRLYGDKPTEDAILSAFSAALSPKVAVVALTWVHSGTGVRLPIAAMADLVRERTQALVCLDAVHGFGARRERPQDLKVDFFVSGGHKWLFGPRGTGLVWGSPKGWERYTPVVPSFSRAAIGAWISGRAPSGSPGELASPGGYHTFENRWALAAAFDLHKRIGADRIADRTEQLATKLKQGIKDHVRLVTPESPALSAGLVCCEVEGVPPAAAVAQLRANGIVASVTPYATTLVRFGTSVATDESDVDRAIAAVKDL